MDFINVSNHQTDKKLPLNIEKISFHTSSSKEVILTFQKELWLTKSFFDIVQNSNSCLINGSLLNYLWQNDLYERLIVIDEKTMFYSKVIEKTLQEKNTNLIKYIKHFQIDFEKNHTFYQNLILVLISLINYKDKIIILDNVLKYIQQKDKTTIDQLIKDLRTNNKLQIIYRQEGENYV